jgi:hypothetical protein
MTMNPENWTVLSTSVSNNSQAGATANTWYNTGPSMVVPIGAWDLSFQASGQCDTPGTTVADLYMTLSTANNSESDAQMTGFFASTLSADMDNTSGFVHRRKYASHAAKQTYYLNIKTSVASSTIWVLGAYGGTKIQATCAYL